MKEIKYGVAILFDACQDWEKSESCLSKRWKVFPNSKRLKERNTIF